MLSVFDSKARVFMSPFYVANLQVGARVFSEVANDAAHAFHKHPEDFTLYHLGSFDDESGKHDLLAQAVNLGMALNFRKELTK